jgi:hypothetical protein
MADLAPGARLVVLGVDLSAHPEVETATVSVLAGKNTSAVAVVRGHRPDLCAPLRGPVVVAGDRSSRTSPPRSPPGSVRPSSPSTSGPRTRTRR